jgi:hypothetical protein
MGGRPEKMKKSKNDSTLLHKENITSGKFAQYY